MGSAFSRALADAFAPSQRRTLLVTLGGTVLLLILLWLGCSALITMLHLSGIRWLDVTISIFGSLAALFLAWLLFPTMTALMLGLFFDRIIGAIERRHYPALPPARRVGMREAIGSACRLAAFSLLLNLLALPVYLLLPVANLAVFYGINGYLVGREYFETIAYRRIDGPGVKAMWRRYRARLIAAGAVIALLLSIPVVGLVAPLIGIAFMLHLFEGLRVRAS